MAESPAHKFGQIIGDNLEDAIEPVLRLFAEKHDLYFDKKGHRSVRPGLKVSWSDSNGNAHDLDFVLERGGTEKKLGNPVAFIEVAWRRYTKHSRNKAQEIQGAIQPLSQTYSKSAPFKGVILAGFFTAGALRQLKSLGFCVLFFDYKSIIKAFSKVGIDAFYDESSPLKLFEQKIKKWEILTDKQKAKIPKELIRVRNKDVQTFVEAMERTIARNIQIVRILPLYGKQFEYKNIKEAINFIRKYSEKNKENKIIRYEVEIRYNNGDEIRGIFDDKKTAIKFLNDYL